MSKRKPHTGNEKQIHAFDKILQENLEAALPGLIKNVLHINAVLSEELPDNVQHTKERKPDLLKKITDDKGDIFVLHIEFQTVNDPDMPYRMLDYFAMLLRKYKIPVVQYVIFIGEGKVTMPTIITNRNSSFAYDIIALSSIDYRVFLRSDKPEEKMLAILADLGKENIALTVKKIAVEIDQAAKGDLERERRKKQLRVLAQLRTLVSEILKNMVSVASFYKEENDIFYLRGEKHGIEKATGKEKTTFVKNMLSANKFTIAEIASYAEVSEDFVKDVQQNLS